MGAQGIKLSIIMPVYNEKDTVGNALERVLSVDLSELNASKEIIIVDDGSTDGTREILKQCQVTSDKCQVVADSDSFTYDVRPARATHDEIKVIFHEKTRGKGAAIRTGFAGATGTVLVVQDADMEYDPNDFKELLKPILAGKYDVVYGSRFIKRTEYAHLRFKLGNILFSFLISALFGSRVTDSYTCYKMFRRRILGSLALESDGFEIEAEITIKLLKAGFSICEIPISYKPRSIREGKKIGWRDAAVGIWTIFKNRLC